MNTLEFKAAIRPQLEEQIRMWLWLEVTPADQRRLATGFRNHVRETFCDEKACKSLQNLVKELPLKFDLNNGEYYKFIIGHVTNVFLIYVDRYAHMDRSCSTQLRIRAFQYRLKNILDDLVFCAHTAEDKLNKNERRIERSLAGACINDWGKVALPYVSFF